MELETPRLRLRPLALTDVPAHFAYLGDAGAMRHTQVARDLRDCRRRLAVHEYRRRHDGYAPWTVIDKTDGRIVGWGGLYDDPFDPGWGVEVGYAFHPEVWGRGYATELVTVCLQIADDVLALPEVGAFARPQNAASRRVLEKCGFQELGFVPALKRMQYRRARRGA
jgi:ribosomal-protein-alanine N-acetyltransferase